jgi:hypothetical protein
LNKIQTNKNDQTSATQINLTNKKAKKSGFKTNLSAGPRSWPNNGSQGISMGGGDK